MGAAAYAIPKNASCFYVVFENEYEEGSDEPIEMDYDSEVSMLKDSLEMELQPRFKKAMIVQRDRDDRVYDLPDRYSNSYCARPLLSIHEGKSYRVADYDVSIEITFVLFVQSGYYDGATLDYMCYVTMGATQEEYGDVDDLKGWLEYEWEDCYRSAEVGERRFRKSPKQMEAAQKWIERTIEEGGKKIEAAFKMNCSKRVVGGPWVYSEVTD